MTLLPVALSDMSAPGSGVNVGVTVGVFVGVAVLVGVAVSVAVFVGVGVAGSAPPGPQFTCSVPTLGITALSLASLNSEPLEPAGSTPAGISSMIWLLPTDEQVIDRSTNWPTWSLGVSGGKRPTRHPWPTCPTVVVMRTAVTPTQSGHNISSAVSTKGTALYVRFSK